VTKLEARLKTGDILAEIDDLIDSVNHTSARMRFERLLPTCEIGDEVAEVFLDKGHCMPPYLTPESRDSIIARWNTMGRQSELIYCTDEDCECQKIDLHGKDQIPGLSQPFILDDDEFEDWLDSDMNLSENDSDALNYMIDFMGRDFVRVSVDYEGLSIDLNELGYHRSNDE